MTSTKEKTTVHPGIAKAKEAGHVVKSAEISDREYIYRSISRPQYKKLQNKVAEESRNMRNSKSPEDFETEQERIRDRAEERLVLIALIEPEVESELDLSTVIPLAGVIPTLAELIMHASGFGVDVQPKSL